MFDLDEFVADCRVALAETDRAGAVRELLERAGRERASIVAALGQPGRGRLEALHHAPDLTVLNVVWTPGMVLAPHDHDMLAAIAVYGGREDNDFYRRRGSMVEAAGGRTVEEGDVLLMGEDPVHGVRSHPGRYTGGIHVYAGDFFNRDRKMWDAETGNEIAEPPPVAELFEEAERRWQARS